MAKAVLVIWLFGAILTTLVFGKLIGPLYAPQIHGSSHRTRLVSLTQSASPSLGLTSPLVSESSSRQLTTPSSPLAQKRGRHV